MQCRTSQSNSITPQCLPKNDLIHIYLGDYSAFSKSDQQLLCSAGRKYIKFPKSCKPEPIYLLGVVSTKYKTLLDAWFNKSMGEKGRGHLYGAHCL